MNKVTQSIVEALTSTHDKSVLSLYIPTNKISTLETAKEDQVRYRNMLGKGFEQWEAEIGIDEAKEVRAQLEEKIDDPAFWNYTNKSLAIFIQKSGFQLLHLPIETDEYIHVGAKFDLAPLRIILGMEQPYYVLSLARHNPKLYYGDSYNLEPIEADFPESPEDALNIDEMFSGSNTVRGIPTGGGGNDTFSTHGQGDSNHAGQEELLKFFRILDDKILKHKDTNRSLPLIIAATESEASTFRGISSYPNILDPYIQGNHKETPLHELHERAWELIQEEVYVKKVSDALHRFNEDKGRQKASSDINEIIDATTTGRVDTLIVGVVEVTNDSVSDANGKACPLIRLQTDYQLNKICELVQAVVDQGGAILGTEAETLGTPTKLAALYRY